MEHRWDFCIEKGFEGENPRQEVLIFFKKSAISSLSSEAIPLTYEFKILIFL
jgi:hypothetical protein